MDQAITFFSERPIQCLIIAIGSFFMAVYLHRQAKAMKFAQWVAAEGQYPEYKSREMVIPKIIESEGFAVSEDEIWCFSDLVIERVYSENKVSEIKERRWFFLNKQFKVNNATEDEFKYALEKRGH